jgi:hypothetical protein
MRISAMVPALRKRRCAQQRRLCSRFPFRYSDRKQDVCQERLKFGDGRPGKGISQGMRRHEQKGSARKAIMAVSTPSTTRLLRSST